MISLGASLDLFENLVIEFSNEHLAHRIALLARIAFLDTKTISSADIEGKLMTLGRLTFDPLVHLAATASRGMANSAIEATNP